MVGRHVVGAVTGAQSGPQAQLEHRAKVARWRGRYGLVVPADVGLQFDR